MKSALGAALAWLALALASPRAPARASEPVASPSEPTRGCGGDGPDVQVTWVDIAAPEALERAVCDWFHDEPWRVRFATAARLDEPPRRPGAGLRVLVQLPSSTQARLLVRAPPDVAESYDVTLPGPLDATSVEVLAQALHSTVQAASERTQRRPPAEPPRPSAPVATTSATPSATRAGAAPSSAAPKPPSDEPSHAPGEAGAEPASAPTGASALGRDVPGSAGAREGAAPRNLPGSPLPVHTGLGYLALWRGDEPLIHGPTLHITVDAARRGPTLGGYFRGTLFTSSARRDTGLSLRSSGVSLGAGASFAAPLTRSMQPLEARAALGAGVDLLALDVRVTDPTLVRLATDRRARPRPFLATEAGVAWRTGRLELALTLLLRWQLLHTTYEVRGLDGQRSIAFEPWRLQPGTSLAAAYVW